MGISLHARHNIYCYNAPKQYHTGWPSNFYSFKQPNHVLPCFLSYLFNFFVLFSMPLLPLHTVLSKVQILNCLWTLSHALRQTLFLQILLQFWLIDRNQLNIHQSITKTKNALHVVNNFFFQIITSSEPQITYACFDFYPRSWLAQPWTSLYMDGTVIFDLPT